MTKKHNYFFILYKFCLLSFLFFCFLSNGSLHAQQKKKKITGAELKLRVGTVYDSNILKYSEKYSKLFMNQNDPGRFHISTFDDLVFYTSFRTAVKFNLIKRRKSKISFNYSRRSYIKNNIKSWDYLSVNLLQNITKRIKVNLHYSLIPNFYIRHFRDIDWIEAYGYVPETFQAFGYSKENFGFWFQNVFFTDTRLKLSFVNSKYSYNEHFTEYDCNNYTYGLQVNQPIKNHLKLIAGIQFTSSDTKDLDRAIYIYDYSDASFNEFGFLLGAKLELPDLRRFSNSIDVECNYGKRFYSSKQFLEADPLHVGRIDDKIKIYFAYSVRVHETLKISAFYKRYQRYLNNSIEINRDFLTEERNYHQYQIGMQLSYNLKIKNKSNSNK